MNTMRLRYTQIIVIKETFFFNPFPSQVNVPLSEIEFLNLDDVDSKQERAFLLGCVRSKEGNKIFSQNLHYILKYEWSHPSKL